MNKPNLDDPRGLYLQRLTSISNLALSCAPRYVYEQLRSWALPKWNKWREQKIFCFLVGATLLISLALIRFVFAIELFLLFSEEWYFTHLSRPVSADILPETKQFYQKTVLLGRGFKPIFSVTGGS